MPFDGPLDAGDQHQAAVGRVRDEPGEIELPLVERDRERVVAQRHRAIDELEGRIRDAVDRVVRGVGVELDLQHVVRPAVQESGRMVQIQL